MAIKPKLHQETNNSVLPEIQIPDFKYSRSPRWSICKECKGNIWKEYTGHEYYHRIKCSKSNGIKYREDRGDS